ncbi:MAG: hypothetical protein ACTSWL_07110 [Promethearchaeota archaeon]
MNKEIKEIQITNLDFAPIVKNIFVCTSYIKEFNFWIGTNVKLGIRETGDNLQELKSNIIESIKQTIDLFINNGLNKVSKNFQKEITNLKRYLDLSKYSPDPDHIWKFER